MLACCFVHTCISRTVLQKLRNVVGPVSYVSILQKLFCATPHNACGGVGWVGMLTFSSKFTMCIRLKQQNKHKAVKGNVVFFKNVSLSLSIPRGIYDIVCFMCNSCDGGMT